MNINRKIITVLAVIALLGVVMVVVDISLVYDVYSKQDYVYTSVGLGWSMEPYIENGDTIVILTDDYPGFYANVGDVLVFQYSDMAVAHRVYNIINGNYYVKGDGNEDVDPWIVDDGAIIGKVIGIVDNTNIVTRYIINQIV